MKNDEEGFHYYIRGLLLIGFALFIFKLLLTGYISSFVAPKMLGFVTFASFTFFVLGAIGIWRSGSDKKQKSCSCHHSRKAPLWIYCLFFLPIATGFLFPDHALTSDVAKNRGVKFGANVTERPSVEQREELTSDEALEQYYDEVLNREVEEAKTEDGEIPLEHKAGFVPQKPPEGYYEELKERMLQKDVIMITEKEYIPMMNILEEHVEDFVGKKVKVKGFIYREDNFKKDEFVIARFGLSCCVADASVYGTLANVKESKEFADDDWVEATGMIEKKEYDGFILPSLKLQTVKKVEAPTNPYVYEMYKGNKLMTPK
jgi:uncharacterized repeat protein (TIGR03943 family)